MIDQLQLMKKFVKSHYNLMQVSGSRDIELGNILRLFDLRSNESVNLKAVPGDDFIFVTEGKICITDADNKKHYLDADFAHVKPYLIPEHMPSISIDAMENSTFFHLDAMKLDYLLAWEDLSNLLSEDEIEIKQRMELIGQSTSFSQIPIANIKELIKRMRVASVEKDEMLITENADAENFYVIAQGSAEVWLQADEDESRKIGELHKGDTFGDEGMMTGRHMISVKMKEDGEVLKLKRDDFNQFLSKSLVEEVPASLAKEMLNNDYKLLDIRFDFEPEFYGYLPNSLHIPLHELKSRLTEIDPDEKYIVYCKSGNRSQVGTLFLEQSDIKAVSLAGGFVAWPFEKISS